MKMEMQGQAENGGKTGTGNGAAQETHYTFEQAFELTGHGRFNIAVMLTCGLIHLNVCMETIGMSYVVTPAQCDLGLTDQDKGLLSASGFIGIVSTSFIWGYMGDTFGRRGVMLPAMLTSAVLSALSAFSVNFWMLLTLRLATGCLLSASSATVYAYLGEMHTSAHRSAAIAWGCIFLSFCFMLLPGLAWIIIPSTWKFHIYGSLYLVPWRVFMLTWTVPCLVASAALFSLPESPKFLLARRGAGEALPVLATMYACNNRKSPGDFPVKKLSDTEDNCTSGGFCEAARGVLMLFRPPLLRCVLVAHFCIFAVFMLSSGMYMWVPDILNSLLTSSDQQSSSVCDILRTKTRPVLNDSELLVAPVCQDDVSVIVFPISIAMGALFATAFLIIGFIIDKVGKKILFGSIMFTCGLLTIASGLIPRGGVGAALLVVALSSGCCASILASISVDVFPTEIRAMAMCVMYMVGRSGAAVGSNLLGAMLSQHCEEAYIFFGVITAVAGVFISLWPNPETVRQSLAKRGLTF